MKRNTSNQQNPINTKTLEHQLEEWKMLNDYINKIDLSYQQPFAIIMAIIAGTATFLCGKSEDFKYALFIFPIGLATILAYVSYQFRIVAVIRGHLSRLEEKMNKNLGENVHMWNSALVETYLAHNNVVNNYMMLPMGAFCVIVIGYCFWTTLQMTLQSEVAILFFIAYWLVVLVSFIFIIFPPFLKNGEIRYRTYHEEDVWKDYENFKKEKIETYNERKNKK